MKSGTYVPAPLRQSDQSRRKLPAAPSSNSRPSSAAPATQPDEAASLDPERSALEIADSVEREQARRREELKR